MHLRRQSLRALLALVTLAAACSSNPLGPFQPQVTNATDNFELQATDVAAVSVTITYRWQNTGTRATINHSTTTTGGKAHLILRDSAGTVVYDKDLVPSLNEPTATGVSGAWTIELSLTGYSGTLNFRAQKL
jgi:hypothetical protein